MPLMVLLMIPLIGCYVAGAIAAIVTAASKPSPVPAAHPAWPDNVIPLDRARRR
jgi:hypothetical protein